MKVLGKYLYVLVGVICLGIGVLIYHNNIGNDIILGDEGLESGIGTAASSIPVTFNGVEVIKTFTEKVVLPVHKGVQVKQVNVKLTPGKKYYLSFNYRSISGKNKFKVDFYKNGKSILIQVLEANSKQAHFEWPVSSTDNYITDCLLRIYDDLFDSSDSGDIVVSNIELRSVDYDSKSKTKVYYDIGNRLGNLPEVERLGYTLQGWYTASTGGTKVTSNTIVNNVMNLYPRWKEIEVSSVSLNKTALTVIKTKTASLTVTVLPNEAINKTVTWTSDNTKVATVDSKGTVKGVAEGTAKITVTSKKNAKAKAVCTVTVVKGTNPITLAATGDLTYSYSTKVQTKAFPAATKAQGAVTYKIISQKNSSGTAVNLFSIPTASKAELKASAKAATGKYTVVIRATAAGNGNYKAGSKDITLSVYIKTTNPITVTTPQKIAINYSTAVQSKAFTAPTKAQGAVTYTIKSQKNSKGAAVTAFSISNNKSATLSVAKGTGAGTYTVVVTAKAAGNNYYYSKPVDITLNITINTINNPMVVKTPQTITIGKTTTEQNISFEAPTKAQGAITYSLPTSKNNATIRKYFAVTSTKNSIKIDKSTPVGTYTVNVLATAKGNGNYKKKDSYIVLTIKVIQKKANPITVTSSQTWSTDYSTSSKDHAFTKATKAQGAVTYSLSPNNNSTTKKYFTIPTAGTASFRMAAKTPPGQYLVIIRATAAGNNTYNDGYKDISMMVTVNQLVNVVNVNSNQSISITPSKNTQDISFAAATNTKGKVTYALIVANNQNIKNYFSIPADLSSSAKIRVKANTPTGEYTMKILVTDGGNTLYKKGTAEITLKVKVVQQVLKGSAEAVIDNGFIDGLGQTFCINKLTNVKGISLSNVDKSLKWTSSNSDIFSPIEYTSNEFSFCTPSFLVFNYNKAKDKTVTITGKKDGQTVMEVQVKIVLANYTVTFNGTNTKYTRKYNEAIGKLPTPAPQKGKKFVGWTDLFNIISENTIVTKNVTYYPIWVDDVTVDSKYDNYNQIARYESPTLNYRIIQERNDKQGNIITLIWVKDALQQLNSALACKDASCSKKGDEIMQQEINTYKYQNKGMVAVNASFYYPPDNPTGTPNGIILSHGNMVKSKGSGVFGLNRNYELKEYSANANSIQNDGVRNTFTASSRTINDNCKDRKNCLATRTQICQIDKYNYAILSYGGSGFVKDAGDYLSARVNCKKDSAGVIIYNLDGGGSRMLYYKKNTSDSLVKLNGGGRLIPDMLYFVEQ